MLNREALFIDEKLYSRNSPNPISLEIKENKRHFRPLFTFVQLGSFR